MKLKKIGKTVLLISAAAATVFVLMRFLFPFVIAAMIAALSEKPISFLQKKLALPRTAVSIGCILAFLSAAAALLYLLCSLFCREFSEFLSEFPELIKGISAPLMDFENRLLRYAASLPDGIGKGLRAGIESAFQSGSLIGEKVYEWLFRAASALIEKTPLLLFSVFTGILSTIMLSADYPNIRSKVASMLSDEKKEKVQRLLHHVKKTVGHWLKAEAELSFIIFLIVTAGLLILGVDYPLLFGLLAGIVDALPVFGAGAVLVPWAIILLLERNIKNAIGIMVLYAVTCIVRQVLEPKLIGKQMGISPLIMLAAIYLGFRLFGIAGMLLFPLLTVFSKSFFSECKQ